MATQQPDAAAVIAALQAEQKLDVEIMDKAAAYITSVPGLVQAAISASLAKGATLEQLSPFSTLVGQLVQKRAEFSAALGAKTLGGR